MPNKSLILKGLVIPDRFFRDFLRGLIDGDGGILRWVHTTNFREQWVLRIASGSREFLEWLKDRIEDIFKTKGKIYQESIRRTQFRLKYGKMAARKILENYYYKDVFGLKRKLDLAKTIRLKGRVVERDTRWT